MYSLKLSMKEKQIGGVFPFILINFIFFFYSTFCNSWVNYAKKSCFSRTNTKRRILAWTLEQYVCMYICTVQYVYVFKKNRRGNLKEMWEPGENPPMYIVHCTVSYKISEEQSLGDQSSADILEYF